MQSGGWGWRCSRHSRIRLAPDAPARLVQQGRVLEIYGSWQVTENGQNEAQMYRTCMDRAAALNLIPKPMVYRTVFCYTEKAGLRQMHCMLRVAVKAPR